MKESSKIILFVKLSSIFRLCTAASSLIMLIIFVMYTVVLQSFVLKSTRGNNFVNVWATSRKSCGKIVFSSKIVFSINKHCQIVFLALYNCLLSSGKLSSEQWTIVFSKNKAVDNCLLQKMSTGKLSSEHWTIVFSKNEAVANCLP